MATRWRGALGDAAGLTAKLALALGLVLLLAVGGLRLAGWQGRACAVCGEAIGLSDYDEEPEFGDVYHASHDHLTHCDYCGRLLAPFSTAGSGVWKLDGRHMCPTCHRDAVVDWGAARRIAEATRQQMAGWGLVFGRADVPISLVDEVTLRRLFEAQGAADGNLEGLTHQTTQDGHDRIEIFVLSGLPRARCEWVVAHELMHAFLFQQHAPVHRPRLEEGAGELAAYRVLRARQDLAHRRMVVLALANHDPVYGGGLRLAAGYERAHGFAAFMRLLARQTDFPPGSRALQSTREIVPNSSNDPS